MKIPFDVWGASVKRPCCPDDFIYLVTLFTLAGDKSNRGCFLISSPDYALAGGAEPRPGQSLYFFMMRQALWPPKPNVFDRAVFTVRFCGSLKVKFRS